MFSGCGYFLGGVKALNEDDKDLEYYKLKVILLIILIFSSNILAECKPEIYHENYKAKINTSVPKTGIILANILWLPVIIKPDEIIATEGPIVAFVSGDSYVSYREIKKSELEFIGTNKEPYMFFKSAFSKPSDIAECSFLDGIRSMNEKYYSINNKLEFYIHNSNSEYSIYILSKNKNIAIEVTTKNISDSDVNYIIAKTYIKKR